MTGRSFTSSELPQLVPSHVAGSHAIALVPTAADGRWASRTAWAFACAAATGGRRVLLVDLSAGTPPLDENAVRTAALGVADAFQGDVALDEVAMEQDVPGLYFIGRGALVDRETIWTSPRWKRLARGFAVENALLILYAPAGALEKLDLDQLDIVVLAKDVAEAQASIPRHRTPRAVITAGVARTSVAGARGRRPPPPGRHVSTYAGLALGALALAAAVGLAWSRSAGTERGQTSLRRAPVSRSPTPAPSASSDTLYYSVQVAAYNSLPEAMALAQKLESGGRVAIVTPARLGAEALWYRVLVGTLPTARAADSVLQGLWRSGTLERPQGTILRAPDTFRIRAASGEVPALRARGIPAYIVPASDGTALVYAGAFDVAEQARMMDSLLAAAHLTGTLSKRVGTPP